MHQPTRPAHPRALRTANRDRKINILADWRRETIARADTCQSIDENEPSWSSAPARHFSGHTSSGSLSSRSCHVLRRLARRVRLRGAGFVRPRVFAPRTSSKRVHVACVPKNRWRPPPSFVITRFSTHHTRLTLFSGRFHKPSFRRRQWRCCETRGRETKPSGRYCGVRPRREGVG